VIIIIFLCKTSLEQKQPKGITYQLGFSDVYIPQLKSFEAIKEVTLILIQDHIRSLLNHGWDHDWLSSSLQGNVW
jgi:hypothetical protein